MNAANESSAPPPDGGAPEWVTIWKDPFHPDCVVVAQCQVKRTAMKLQHDGELASIAKFKRAIKGSFCPCDGCNKERKKN